METGRPTSLRSAPEGAFDGVSQATVGVRGGGCGRGSRDRRGVMYLTRPGYVYGSAVWLPRSRSLAIDLTMYSPATATQRCRCVRGAAALIEGLGGVPPPPVAWAAFTSLGALLGAETDWLPRAAFGLRVLRCSEIPPRCGGADRLPTVTTFAMGAGAGTHAGRVLETPSNPMQSSWWISLR